MPVLRRDDGRELRDQRIGDRNRLVPVRDRKRTTGTEVVLEIDQEQRTHGRILLERELEALLRQAVVFAAIEAVEACRAVAHPLLELVRLDEQIHREDLLAEVSL